MPHLFFCMTVKRESQVQSKEKECRPFKRDPYNVCLADDSLETSGLFSLKNNEKIFMNVVCCSRDWRFKG